MKCASMGMCLHARGEKSANEDPFDFSTFFSYFIMFQGIFFNPPPLSRSLILMLLNASGVHPNPVVVVVSQSPELATLWLARYGGCGTTRSVLSSLYLISKSRA